MLPFPHCSLHSASFLGSHRKPPAAPFFEHRPFAGANPSGHVFASAGGSSPFASLFAAPPSAANGKSSSLTTAAHASGGVADVPVIPLQAPTSPPEVSFFLVLALSPFAPAPKMSAAAFTSPFVPVDIKNAPI